MYQYSQLIFFIQLRRLIELRSFCESLGPLKDFHTLLLSTEEWDMVENITSVLSYFAKLTTTVQEELISLSDFIGGWAKIKMELSKHTDSSLAQKLLLEMKKREGVLFNNKVLNAAVFND